MNELQAKRLLAQAVGATGPINNDRQFWTTILTALNGGEFASANNEHQFWARFATLLGEWEGNLAANEAVVTSGQALTGTGGTFTPTVVNNVVTGGTWTAA